MERLLATRSHDTDHDELDHLEVHQRNMLRNIRLAFQLCTVKGVQRAWAEQLLLSESQVSTLLWHGQGRPVNTDHLEAAAKVSLLRNSPDYNIKWWSLPPSEFDDKLRFSGFGSYAGYIPLFEFLNSVKREPCFFLHEDGLRLLFGSYRGYGQPTTPYTGAPPEARGHIGQRYGLLARLPPGNVVRAVEKGEAVALIVHRDQVNGKTTVWSIDPSRSGAIRIVDSLKPMRDPEDNEESYTPCLLIGAEDGDRIEGNVGMRDVYIFLFVRDMLTNGLKDAVNKELHDPQANFLGRLEYAVRVAAQHPAGSQVVTMRFVYEALPAK